MSIDQSEKAVAPAEVGRRPSRRGVFVAVGVMVVSVGVLIAVVDVRAVAGVVARSDGRYLAAASAALLAGTGVYALRWQLLLGGRATWLSTLYAAGVGHAVNLLVPLRLGEPARVMVLGRASGLAYSEVASTVVVERLWEQVLRLAALAGAIAFGVGLRPSPATVAGALAALAGAALGLAWLRRHPAWILARVPVWLARLPRLEESRVRETLTRLLGGLALATSPRRLVQGAVTSVGAWALYWAFHALVLLSLRVPLAPAEVITLSLAALALAPPSAPTSPGVYHASIVVPLALVGYSETTLTAYAVVLHALLMLWLLLLGLVGFARSGLSAREVVPSATV